MSATLALDGVSVFAGDVALVRAASLRVGAGEAFTLLGETGSGKTLLLNAVTGTLPPELSATGTVRILDHVSRAEDGRSRHACWGRTVGLLPQEPWLALDPTMRVLPQVAEGYRYVREVEPGEATHRAQADLDALGLREAARKYPFMLSGGMAQRVAFAAMRTGGAPVVLVDEPTKGLDATLRASIVGILQGIVREGGTLLTITHDVAVARALGGTIGVMLNGEIVEAGPAAQVLGNPQHEYTRRLLAAEPAAWSARVSAPAGDVVLSARGLAKRFGTQEVFAGIDLDVHAGERIAITGPSGSGKTTLGSVLLGLMPADAGRVTRSAGPRWGFQKVYQDPVMAFAPTVTIRRSLRDLVVLHGLAWGSVEDYMRRLRLGAELLDRVPGQVSGGELQRFALIRILLLQPRLIFADEPTSRLDPVSQQETMDVLVDAAAECGAALVLVTHDLAIASNVASRVLMPFGAGE